MKIRSRFALTQTPRARLKLSAAICDLRDEETLEKIPGIGKAIAAKIKELAETGSLKFFEELRAEFPAAILEFFSIPGLGAKKIKALYEKLKVSSIAELQTACESGRVAELPGFGKTTQEKLCQAIANARNTAVHFSSGRSLPKLRRCKTICARILTRFKSASPAVIDVTRRSCATSISSSPRKSPEAITRIFVAASVRGRLIAQGPTKSSVRLRSGIQCDLRVVTAEYPFALNYFTGSKEHNIVMRNRALNRGWTLNEYRLRAAPIVETKVKTKRPNRLRKRAGAGDRSQSPLPFRKFTKKRNFIARSDSITFRRSCAKTAANSKRQNRENCRA